MSVVIDDMIPLDDYIEVEGEVPTQDAEMLPDPATGQENLGMTVPLHHIRLNSQKSINKNWVIKRTDPYPSWAAGQSMTSTNGELPIPDDATLAAPLPKPAVNAFNYSKFAPPLKPNPFLLAFVHRLNETPDPPQAAVDLFRKLHENSSKAYEHATHVACYFAYRNMSNAYRWLASDAARMFFNHARAKGAVEIYGNIVTERNNAKVAFTIAEEEAHDRFTQNVESRVQANFKVSKPRPENHFCLVCDKAAVFYCRGPFYYCSSKCAHEAGCSDILLEIPGPNYSNPNADAPMPDIFG